MPQNNAAAGGVMRSNAPVQIVVKLIPLQYFRLLGDWRIHRVERGYLIIKKTSECSESNAARKDSEAKGSGTESSTNNEQCDTSFCDKDDVSTCDDNIEDEDYTEIENKEDDEYINVEWIDNERRNGQENGGYERDMFKEEFELPKVEVAPTYQCRNTHTFDKVKEVIQILKTLDNGDCVDGETMQYILEQVGMDVQMLNQLMGQL